MVTNREPRHPSSADDDPIAMADRLLGQSTNRSVSPAADSMEGAAGPLPASPNEGQLGPDEISEPDEVIRNNEAKQHH
jgi:hypothetical protein